MPAVAPRDKLRNFPGTGRPRRFGHPQACQPFEPGAPTLDERISTTWAGLVSSGTAECPVCATRLRAAQPCSGCGSELS